MRLKISESKNSKSLYVIRSTYENGKHSSKVVERLGTYDKLKKTHDDPIAWAKEYIRKLNEQEKEEKREVIVRFKQSKHLTKDKQQHFYGAICSYNRYITSQDFLKSAKILLRVINLPMT